MTEDERKAAESVSNVSKVSLEELPKSNIKFKRVSLAEMTLSDCDIFRDKVVIG